MILSFEKCCQDLFKVTELIHDNNKVVVAKKLHGGPLIWLYDSNCKYSYSLTNENNNNNNNDNNNICCP